MKGYSPLVTHGKVGVEIVCENENDKSRTRTHDLQIRNLVHYHSTRVRN